ncbi:MAG: LysE family transporter [Endomicrobium sp.]|jgi:threonine/homoserine/homoserine lactone efflux protein|nr:LysE family transporter [Endomicrobium sp.]
MDIIINKKNNLLFDGLKTGLLLKIMGMGPICVLIFKLSLSMSFRKLILGIIGITLADIIYIFLAVISISVVIKKLQRFQRIFDILVGIALIYLEYCL